MAQEGVILRMGARVLIDEDRFFDWLDRANGITETEVMVGA